MTIQLLLSSEIDLFEHKQADFLENSMKLIDFGKILYVIYIRNLSKIKDFRRIFKNIRLLVIKRTYLRAQEELDGHPIIVSK